MATLPELERALVNAHNAGDTDAARKLAAVIGRAREDIVNLIPDTPVSGTVPVEPEPTIGEHVLAAPETAATMATGATGGTVGFIGGALKGLAEQILSGNFGTQEAVNLIQQEAMTGAESLTYQPRSRASQKQVEAIGEVGAQLAPIAPLAGEMQMMARGAKAAAPAVGAAGAVAAERGVTAARAAGEAIRDSITEPQIQRKAGVDVETVRRTRAEQMPVPFSGESALTRGQASRDYEQLQFEKETAKLGEQGEPLRARAENQTVTLLANMDALFERAGPIAFDARDIGKTVDQALVNRANVYKERIKKAYDQARTAGAMADPVKMDSVPSAIINMERHSSLAKNITPIIREAERLGVVKRNESGEIVPGTVTLDDAEIFRSFVNDATDIADKRESRARRVFINAIDADTEGKGGELYQKARKLYSDYSQEFVNTGLTKRLLANKRGTDERAIAFEDVFKKVVLDSPIEEVNKLRSTLLKAGAEGKQAWADMKAATITHIKESSLSASQADAKGTPLLSPDKLNRVIARLDKEGKLESLFGKKQAQIIRDLGEIAKDIYTAPPGAINFSNTASALQVALDSLVTFGVTGVPAPVATALRESARYARDKKIQRRINESLEGK